MKRHFFGEHNVTQSSQRIRTQHIIFWHYLEESEIRYPHNLPLGSFSFGQIQLSHDWLSRDVPIISHWHRIKSHRSSICFCLNQHFLLSCMYIYILYIYKYILLYVYIYIYIVYIVCIYIFICNIGMVKALFFSMFQPTCLAVKLFTCPVACCPNWSMPALGGGGAATAPPMHCRPRAWWRRNPEIWWVNIRNPNHQKLVNRC